MFGIKEVNKTHLFIVLIIISWVNIYWIKDILVTQEHIVEHYSEQLSYERIQRILDIKQEYWWLQYAFNPVYKLFKFSFLSLWMLTGFMLLGYNISLKKIFNSAIVAEFVWEIPKIIKIFWFGIFDRNYTLEELKLFNPFSLISLFERNSLDTWLIFPLKSLNLLQILYALIFALTLRVLTQKEEHRVDLKASLPIYFTGFILWITFLTFLSINLSA